VAFAKVIVTRDEQKVNKVEKGEAPREIVVLGHLTFKEVE
jgi:hypothetical protein